MLSYIRQCLVALVAIAGFFGGVYNIESASAQSRGYAIKTGDKLRVEVFEDSSLTREVLVLPDGSISFPLVGSVAAAGRSLAQVSASVQAGLAPNFATSPTVHVSIASLSAPAPTGGIAAGPDGINVYAIGEIGSPGRLTIDPDTTLLQFLASAGGLGQFAADKRIELLRTHTETGAITTYLFNYRVPQGDSQSINGSTKLQPGDVVKVPQKRLFE